MSKVKIMTYNIRHGRGIDLHYSLERTAAAIKEADPDIVGINEIYQIPRLLEQVSKLARLLDMEYVFQKNVSLGTWGGYGNAILSKTPIVDSHDIRLPRHRGIEKRGMLVVKTEIGRKAIYFGSTHLSLGRYNRFPQINYLSSKLSKYTPLIFAGDLNASPVELNPLLDSFTSVGAFTTYPANRPSKQFDYVFYDKAFTLSSADTVTSVASDHLPIVATFEIGP